MSAQVMRGLGKRRPTAEGDGTWWDRTHTSLGYLTPSLPVRPVSRGPMSPTLEGSWNKEEVPLFEEDQVSEVLSKLDIRKSLGPVGMHPQVLRWQMPLRPLSIIVAQS